MRIGLQMDSGQVIAASVDGRGIDASRYRSRQARWGLDFIAPPDSGFVLLLTLKPAPRSALGLLARIPGLPALAGVQLPSRPTGVLTVQSGDISVIYKRIGL